LRLEEDTDMKLATLKFLLPAVLSVLSPAGLAQAAAALPVPAKPNIVFIVTGRPK
jgi:hypothetical protein